LEEFSQCIRLGKEAGKGQQEQRELALEGGILIMNLLCYFHAVDKFLFLLNIYVYMMVNDLFMYEKGIICLICTKFWI